MSTRPSSTVLPASRLSRRPSSSRSRTRRSATRRRSAARSATGVSGQGPCPESKAWRAAATARSVSFSSPSATTANGRASAGARISRGAPEAAARPSPPAWMVCGSCRACCPAMIGVAFRSSSVPLCHPRVTHGDRRRPPPGPDCMRNRWPKVGWLTEHEGKSGRKVRRRVWPDAGSVDRRRVAGVGRAEAGESGGQEFQFVLAAVVLQAVRGDRVDEAVLGDEPLVVGMPGAHVRLTAEGVGPVLHAFAREPVLLDGLEVKLLEAVRLPGLGGEVELEGRLRGLLCDLVDLKPAFAVRAAVVDHVDAVLGRHGGARPARGPCDTEALL